MSIPADFRKVLEAGDPDTAVRGSLSVQVVYGDHLKGHLAAYTMAAFAEMATEIQSIRPTTREAQERKTAAQHLILRQSQPLEVDKDGRTVLPQRLREKLGLPEGEVMFAGSGDHFQIWPAEAYRTQVGAPMRAYAEAQDEGYDPMTGIYAVRSG
jgi:MraZ protein